MLLLISLSLILFDLAKCVRMDWSQYYPLADHYIFLSTIVNAHSDIASLGGWSKIFKCFNSDMILAYCWITKFIHIDIKYLQVRDNWYQSWRQIYKCSENMSEWKMRKETNLLDRFCYSPKGMDRTSSHYILYTGKIFYSK